MSFSSATLSLLVAALVAGCVKTEQNQLSAAPVVQPEANPRVSWSRTEFVIPANPKDELVFEYR